jgi:hypothetical protein
MSVKRSQRRHGAILRAVERGAAVVLGFLMHPYIAHARFNQSENRNT